MRCCNNETLLVIKENPDKFWDFRRTVRRTVISVDVRSGSYCMYNLTKKKKRANIPFHYRKKLDFEKKSEQSKELEKIFQVRLISAFWPYSFKNGKVIKFNDPYQKHLLNYSNFV